jgi:di/tricarboxylate transporter
LKLGDTLLVVGPWRAIHKLQQAGPRELVVLNLPVELDEVIPAPGRAIHALAILALVVGLMVSGLLPNVQAALIGCLLLGLFACVDMNSAYRAIHWQSLILIVGMLPFSIALQRTGGVDLAAEQLLHALGDAGPQFALAAIFILTALLGLFISNTATAVLMVPVALAVAQELQSSPYPFAMTVALAASAAFMTPVSSPVNTLVLGPGNYRFVDFVRVGVPFALVALVATVTLVPLVFPF